MSSAAGGNGAAADDGSAALVPAAIEDLTAATLPPDEVSTVPLPDIGASDGTVPWRALLAEAAAALADAGFSSAEVEARRMVEEAAGHEGSALLARLDDPVTVGGVAAVDRMVDRRQAGEPLQYVLGRWAFRSLDLMVDRRVLIPRPETEGLVDHVLAELDRIADSSGPGDDPAPAPIVVDLGCGSGAIGLAVATERRGTEVHAVDVDPGAVQVTRANLAGLGVAGASVTVREGSWWDGLPPELTGRVAVVASNPPYVAADDPLPPEVAAWEPRGALIPGPTGLEAIEEIVTRAPSWLAPSGALVVEIGETQGAAVRAMAAGVGLTDIEVRPDLSGRDRALVARRPLPS